METLDASHSEGLTFYTLHILHNVLYRFSEVPNKENLLYNQELWYLLIISVILVTLIYDLGMIL